MPLLLLLVFLLGSSVADKVLEDEGLGYIDNPSIENVENLLQDICPTFARKIENQEKLVEISSLEVKARIDQVERNMNRFEAGVRSEIGVLRDKLTEIASALSVIIQQQQPSSVPVEVALLTQTVNQLGQDVRELRGTFAPNSPQACVQAHDIHQEFDHLKNFVRKGFEKNEIDTGIKLDTLDNKVTEIKSTLSSNNPQKYLNTVGMELVNLRITTDDIREDIRKLRNDSQPAQNPSAQNIIAELNEVKALVAFQSESNVVGVNTSLGIKTDIVDMQHTLNQVRDGIRIFTDDKAKTEGAYKDLMARIGDLHEDVKNGLLSSDEGVKAEISEIRNEIVAVKQSLSSRDQQQELQTLIRHLTVIATNLDEVKFDVKAIEVASKSNNCPADFDRLIQNLTMEINDLKQLDSKPINSIDNQTTTDALTGQELAERLTVGSRVVRGKDWMWGDQDGNPPREGTVEKNVTEHGWVEVRWDVGYIDNYRMGFANKYDLKLAVQCVTVPDKAIPTNCTDGLADSKCDLVVRLNSCSHEYYSKACCRTCKLAGQLPNC